MAGDSGTKGDNDAKREALQEAELINLSAELAQRREQREKMEIIEQSKLLLEAYLTVKTGGAVKVSIDNNDLSFTIEDKEKRRAVMMDLEDLGVPYEFRMDGSILVNVNHKELGSEGIRNRLKVLATLVGVDTSALLNRSPGPHAQDADRQGNGLSDNRGKA